MCFALLPDILQEEIDHTFVCGSTSRSIRFLGTKVERPAQYHDLSGSWIGI